MLTWDVYKCVQDLEKIKYDISKKLKLNLLHKNKIFFIIILLKYVFLKCKYNMFNWNLRE